MAKRKCKHCKAIKKMSEFESYTRPTTGVINTRTTCKNCCSILNEKTTYKCQICKEEKDKGDFPKSSTSIIGIERTCKVCKRKMYIESGKPQIIARDRRGRYQSDPEFRERLKAHSAKQRRNFKERTMLSQARIRATRKGLDFNITINDIVIPKMCPILEIPIVTTNSKRLWDSASLDRVDNTKGYVKGNVRVISYMANHLKGLASRDNLEKFSKNIIPYLNNMI